MRHKHIVNRRRDRQDPRRYRGRAEPAYVGPTPAFICQSCLEPIGDPSYTGPIGHAPQNICFTCWVNAFEQPPKDWPKDILALWYMSQGWTQAQAAEMTELTVEQLRWRRRWLKKNISRFPGITPTLLPNWTLHHLRGDTHVQQNSGDSSNGYTTVSQVPNSVGRCRRCGGDDCAMRSTQRQGRAGSGGHYRPAVPGESPQRTDQGHTNQDAPCRRDIRIRGRVRAVQRRTPAR